jgi:hypothetical protein
MDNVVVEFVVLVVAAWAADGGHKVFTVWWPRRISLIRRRLLRCAKTDDNWMQYA